MPGLYGHEKMGFRFYDSTGAGNALARYSLVSLASAAQVAAANAAGIPGNVGEICVQTPIAAGLPTADVLGVAEFSCLNGQDISVVCGGVFWAQASAAFAENTLLFGALAETRTSAQTPFVDNAEMMIPLDPRFNTTFNLVLVDDTALPAANTIHYPLGRALKAAVAKYDIVPVWLQLGYRR